MHHLFRVLFICYKQASLSVDQKENLFSPPVALSVTENDMSAKKIDAGTDLFSLLYVSEHDSAVVPPSRWATFDCKTTFWLHCFFKYLTDNRIDFFN